MTQNLDAPAGTNWSTSMTNDPQYGWTATASLFDRKNRDAMFEAYRG